MKTNRSRRGWFSKRPQNQKSRLTMEGLEDRNLLAANILATADDALATSDEVDNVVLAVEGESNVTLILETRNIDGSLNPTAPNVTATSGQVMATHSVKNDAEGSTGRTVVTVTPGEYTFDVAAQSGFGSYQVSISMMGDFDADAASVSDREALQAMAAMMQDNGTINPVTDRFFYQAGIDVSQDQYDSSMDANLNGTIESSEVGLVDANKAAGPLTVSIAADVTGPVISAVGLVVDSGVSDTDGISTSADIGGEIADENEVTAFRISVDGGDEVDILPQLGDISSGSFVISQSVLADAAGGSLAGGSHTVSMVAEDAQGNVTETPAAITFVLIDGNQAPAFVGDATATTNEDDPYSLDLAAQFTDANTGDVLTYTVDDLPGWMSRSDDVLSGTPANEDVGTYAITLRATDSQGLTASATLSLEVINVNDAPIVVVQDQTIEEDEPFTLDVSLFVADLDVGDEVTITVEAADGILPDGEPDNPGSFPAWLTYDSDTTTLSGTPTQADVGEDNDVGVYLRASDGEAASEGFFTIRVRDVNDVPELVQMIPDQTATEGNPFSIQLGDFFEDSDPGDSLTYAIQAKDGETLPSWLAVNNADGTLGGTPDDPDVGESYDVVVSATDSFGASVSDSFILDTVNINDDPVIVAVPENTTLGDSVPAGTIVTRITAADPDVGDTVTLELSGTDASSFVLDSTTGEVSVASGATLVSGKTLMFTVTASDSNGGSDSVDITVTITDNFPPTANDDSGFSTTDSESLTIAASDLTSNDTDPDSDTLTVTSVDATSASGATVTLSGSSIIYDPTNSTTLLQLHDGESIVDTFDYTVSDGNGGTDTATVSVTVEGTDLIELSLGFFDSGGNEVTVVQPGDSFELRVFVEDIRSDPKGVFAAFLDIEFNDTLVSVDGGTEGILHAEDYSSVVSNDSDALDTAGLIDDVGGSAGTIELGGGQFELLRIEMVASSTSGSAQFVTGPPAATPFNYMLLFGVDTQIPVEQVIFPTTTLNIAGPIPPLSGGSTATNQLNPLDTNNDGVVTSLDALIVINQMNGTGSGPYPDVNADGAVAPNDALAVINHLNSQQVQAPLAARESAVGGQAESTGPAWVTEDRNGFVEAPSPIPAVGYALETEQLPSRRAFVGYESLVDSVFEDLA